MTDRRFAELIDLYLKKEISLQEKEELISFLTHDASDVQTNEFFEKTFKDFKPQKAVFSSEQSNRILNDILKTEAGKPIVKNNVPYQAMFAKVLMAALILLVCSLGFHFYNEHNKVELPTPKITQVFDEVILPLESNKAILTLADGTNLILDEAKNGEIAQQQGIGVLKNKGGEISYTTPWFNHSITTQLVYNTITTPKGGQYQVRLPDGSKVWLNAKSSLKFPVVFDEKERLVELTGEAYFEIVSNKTKPFRVKSAKQMVEVLGTKFNMNIYDDESLMSTSVLEGSVKVANTLGNAVIIKPGEQSVQQDKTNDLIVQKFDSEQVMAWKNGYFYFKNEDIESIMRKVSRWYDVDIIYEKEYTNQKFVGTISKYEDISKVLEMLELTDAVHFKTEGRRVKVMK